MRFRDLPSCVFRRQPVRRTGQERSAVFLAAVVSVMEDLTVHLDHTEHLRLEGLIFEYTHGSVAVMEEGCYNTIGGCVIRNTGNDGIRIAGGHHNGVSGCDFYNIGEAGINIQGGDRLTLEPGHHFAVNNHIVQPYQPDVSPGYPAERRGESYGAQPYPRRASHGGGVQRKRPLPGI